MTTPANPLLDFSDLPLFDAIRPEHVQPAIEALLAEANTALETATANLEAGKKFLEENGKREGVITTKSGLQYEVIAKGGEEMVIVAWPGLFLCGSLMGLTDVSEAMTSGIAAAGEATKFLTSIGRK